MKELQAYITHLFERRRVNKHNAKLLDIREEIAKLTVMIAARKDIRFYYHSDQLETARLIGKLAALKVRLDHLTNTSPCT